MVEIRFEIPEKRLAQLHKQISEDKLPMGCLFFGSEYLLSKYSPHSSELQKRSEYIFNVGRELGEYIYLNPSESPIFALSFMNRVDSVDLNNLEDEWVRRDNGVSDSLKVQRDVLHPGVKNMSDSLKSEVLARDENLSEREFDNWILSIHNSGVTIGSAIKRRETTVQQLKRLLETSGREIAEKRIQSDFLDLINSVENTKNDSFNLNHPR